MDPAIREKWKGLACVIMVHRHTVVGVGKTRYYMSSLQDILRRLALNAHNRMPGKGKRCNRLPKSEMRAALDPAYLELLLSLG
jgi:hypothetical protein